MSISINQNNNINYNNNEILSFSGFLYSHSGVTYTDNSTGIRIHKEPPSAFKTTCSYLKTGEFIDAETGKLTDEFYGGWNDFNDWFLGKVMRGEKFFLYLISTDTREKLQYHEVECFFSKENWKDKAVFRCNKLGEWYRVS